MSVCVIDKSEESDSPECHDEGRERADTRNDSDDEVMEP